MELKMEVYTPQLQLVGLLETFDSVIWEPKAFGAGTFSIRALMTDETRTLLVPDNIIWIAGEDAGVIEHIEKSADSSGDYFNISGFLLTGILSWRVLWGQYNLYGDVKDLMQSLVRDNAVNPTRGDVLSDRILPGLVLSDAALTGIKTRKQKTGGSILTALEELGQSNQVAYGVRFNAAYPRMEFWVRAGVNRSINQTDHPSVFYSTELDDVLQAEYTYDSSEYRNVALVGGEGEGAERIFVPVVGGGGAVGTTYAIQATVFPDGSGTVYGAGRYAENAEVTLTATPVEDATFVAWQENGETISTSESLTFTATSDRELVAIFAVEISYTISVSVSPSDYGTVSGAGVYDEGDTVTLTASPETGKIFTAWQENGETIGTSTTLTFPATADRTITAVFAAVPSLENASWETISSVAKTGTASDYWSIGDTKSISINGTTYYAQIAGFDHDNVTDSTTYGRAKAGITFLLGIPGDSSKSGLYSKTYPVKSSNTNSGGWKTSPIRTTNLPTIKGYLPSGLQNVIVAVNKLGSNGQQSSTINTTSDELWLPSRIEITTGTSTYTKEGSIYQLYSNGASLVRYYGGTAQTYWTRSPVITTNTSFVAINASGSILTGSPTTAHYIFFGFCV